VLKVIAEQLLSFSKGLFEVRPYQILAVATLLHQEARVVYSVHRAGYGKTMMNFLTARYLCQHNKKVVYVVKDEFLKAQAKYKAKQLGVAGFQILCYKEFDSYAEPDTILICDEYYDAMIEAKIGLNENGGFNPIFSAGFTSRTFITTATYSTAFLELLMRTFGSVVCLGGPQVSMDDKTQDASYRLQVICKPTPDALTTAAVNQVLSLV